MHSFDILRRRLKLKNIKTLNKIEKDGHGW
jgi:hypothetical protein